MGIDIVDFVAGCLGGSAGVVVGHPLDTVKTREINSVKRSHLIRRFKTISGKEGIPGFYKGLTAPLSTYAFINAIIFGVEGNVLKHMENPGSIRSHVIAGSVAGLAQSGICSVTELGKIKMQLKANKEHFTGPRSCLHVIYKVEGVRGLCRGLPATVLREIPAFGIYFGSYEMMCRGLTPNGAACCPTWGILLAGGMAGSFSWLFTCPIDVIKTRIQADGEYRHGTFRYSYSGYFDCIRKSLNTEGWRVLFKGVKIAIIRAFPTNAVTFGVVEFCKDFMTSNGT